MGYRKYRAKKVKTEEGTFDSKKEYRRYLFLKELEKQGRISDLQRQVPFELIPSQREPDSIGQKGGRIRGKVIERAVKYFADFTYIQDGERIVEDVKGVRTPEYVIKRKLMLYLKDIRIKEV